MAQDLLVSILVYLCIFQNSNAAAFSLRGGVNEREISPARECPNCGKLEKRIRREIGGLPARDIKPKYTKTFAEKFHEYSYPRKTNSLLKGWGAGGMPFNVLYTPNSHQQKMMKNVPRKQEEGKLRKEQRKNRPLIYNLVLEDEKPLKARENPLKKHSVPRKYYSLIPQLFVSYGW